MSQVLVSIVIPFYNRESSLRLCVNSILRAQYKTTEIILVDDGSTDSSTEIADSIASKYENVRVIHQQNKGVSSARNRGIEEANGEWITFVDSDDVVLSNHFDIVLAEANGVDLLMVESGRRKLDNLFETPCIKVKRIESDCAREYLMSPKFNPFKNIFYSIWDKFFRLDIISSNNIRFDESMSLGEDQVFVCEYLKHAGKMVRTTLPTYICVDWDIPIEHLGRKLRKPEDYLYNQIKGYEALKGLCEVVNNQVAEKYAVNFGIDRPITKILYGFAKKENQTIIDKEHLFEFLENKVVPFLHSIDTRKYNATSIDVRIARAILLNRGVSDAYKWADLWVNHIRPIIVRTGGVLFMPKNYISYRVSKFSH